MRLGVIDIGSNSIKLLVAEKASPLVVCYQTTLETRIGHGISRGNSYLTDEAMQRGVTAVMELIKKAHPYQPSHFKIVATSAVRDAGNRMDFVEKIRQLTGLDLTILSGDEEAAYIAWGVLTDTALKNENEFCLVDLGGGSLEMIHIRAGDVLNKVSLPLGAVRLTEKYITDPHRPISSQQVKRINDAVRDSITASGFQFPSGVRFLGGTGGALSVARAIRAAWLGRSFEQTESKLELAYLRYLCIELVAMPLEERMHIGQMDASRADIMPAALLTLITAAELAGADSYRHSLHNLRYGIAAKHFADMA